jgi:hypothetical protein
MSKYYQYDTGTEILVDVGSNVATATVTRLYVKKPSGEQVTWEAGLGTIGAGGEITTLRYITGANDWDETGHYTLQAYVEMPSWKGRGDSVKFEIKPPFA